MALKKVAYGFAALDVVLADLSRDPRSEYCYERPSGPAVVKASGIVPNIAPGDAPKRARRRHG